MEPSRSRLSRRSALKRIGAGAAVVWAAPTVLSMNASSAAAAASPPPPPHCEDGELVPYNARGWRYRETCSNGDMGFERPGYDDSGFAPGTGGFGSGGDDECVIMLNAHTEWDPDTDLLLRRDVMVPTAATAVTIFVATNTTVQVFWDAVLIGGGSHDGCPVYDSFSVAAPPTEGNHVLALRALARSDHPFVDARVTVTC